MRTRTAGIVRQGGVDLARCLIGHSCANPNVDYHMRIVRGGSFVGFDRNGKAWEQTDEVRAKNLTQVIPAGFVCQAMVSQDSILFE